MQAEVNTKGLISILMKAYGPQVRPPSSDPFHLILWEQIGYLIDDDRRLKAFNNLAEATGLLPDRIASATEETLLGIARSGGAIGYKQRASRLKQTAQIVLEKYDGNLKAALPSDVRVARRVLKSFPMIGEPGADKILLLSGIAPTFSLESNGLRVLLRVGVGKEDPSYTKSYTSVMKELEGHLPVDQNWLSEAHLVLRYLGQNVCRRSNPSCTVCPISNKCSYFHEQAMSIS
jgi:endonuclease III